MDTRKQAIIDALRAFISERPGFDLHNYGTMADYRQDSRRATRQKNDALQFLRDIELRDSISADDILKEAKSGRLAIKVDPYTQEPEYTSAGGNYADMQRPIQSYRVSVDYCTGQYWCTEYRGAVARLCASVLWTWKREQCMPSGPNKERLSSGDTTYWDDNARNGKGDFISAGDWLRASFRREYGRTLAGRYFT